MHTPTMAALEFTRIQNELAAHSACQLGKELALNMQPLTSLLLTRQVQQETTEARAILKAGRSIPFGGIQDVRLAVERAENGGVLRPEHLMSVADTIYGCRQLHKFLTEYRTAAPLLSRHAEAFGKFDMVEDEIRRCIEHGTVSSRASQGLRQVRLEVASIEGRIQDRLQGILKQYRQHLQEALITTRNGRYVIPVKASSKGSVPGAVHGASASGGTVFVEPEAIAQLCAELESWRAMEQAEIEQVLMVLSGHVAAHAHGLQATLSAAAQLDFIFARGRLSIAWDAAPVVWNETGLIDLKGARHPLLGKNAIGNRIRMTAESRVLIVTGPNTGGKTLLLKTLGLLVIIARCGLHIPVAEGSTLYYFENVCADIGDHQSLEQSLSTFSGHIANVAPMVEQAGPNTLVLLDELGSGTDPHEGTGLGIALLEAFLKKGAYVLITTHLRDIKEFGRKTKGCAFAGMGFDGETLKPTYHLIYGTLGESHALEIAARNGLQAEIVARARELVYGEGGIAPAPALLPEQAPALLPEQAPVAEAPVEIPEAVPTPTPTPAPVVTPRVTVPVPSQNLSIVATAISPTRCRVWHDGKERELAVPDSVKTLFPEGLVAGDRVRVKDGRLIEAASRQTVLVNRDADTQVESVVAANLTRLAVVMSAKAPDFHTTVLARHLIYAERQGVTPIICLTKADLVPPAVAEDWLKPFRASGYEVVIVSGLRGKGIDELKALLAGQTTAVMAVAGAGKSTLIAALTGQKLQPETGAAKLLKSLLQPQTLPLGDNSWLVDVPGLRELGVWKPDLAGGFREFGAYSGGCNRPGCLHMQEPGCAVRDAVAEGRLHKQRYEQYLQLLQHMRLA
ncbi:MAG TPA: ribosome small subunit-dependent GTPase A [Symbiobacteriaceae bacterium]|nr:ribosome small subunit-dependent GTPase A [Symbiobacteriaceae bacterium]